MEKSEAIKRVRTFLQKIPHISLDLSFEDCTFKNVHRRYFLYRDDETRGVFDNDFNFVTKKEINEIIIQQMNGDCKWDHIIIFDVIKNKIIEPKI